MGLAGKPGGSINYAWQDEPERAQCRRARIPAVMAGGGVACSAGGCDAG